MELRFVRFANSCCQFTIYLCSYNISYFDIFLNNCPFFLSNWGLVTKLSFPFSSTIEYFTIENMFQFFF